MGSLMKHIRKFKTFENIETLPITSKNFLTNFYSCDDCDAMWKEFNNTAENCKFCNSNEIEELQEDEWYEISKSRLDEEDYKELLSEKEEDEKSFIDLLSLKNKENNGNN